MEVGPLDTVREADHLLGYHGLRGRTLARQGEGPFPELDRRGLPGDSSIHRGHEAAPAGRCTSTSSSTPRRRVWERVDNGNSGEMPTDEPLDQISFFYFARTLPLEVGDEYVLQPIFQGEGESGDPAGAAEGHGGGARPAPSRPSWFSPSSSPVDCSVREGRRNSTSPMMPGVLLVLMKSNIPLIGCFVSPPSDHHRRDSPLSTALWGSSAPKMSPEQGSPVTPDRPAQ